METTDLLTLANSCVLSLNDIKLKTICFDVNLYKGEEIENKPLILQYLKSFKPTWFTTGRLIDNISGKKIDIVDNSYDDGVFIWSESDIYHFERYNMPLSKEFTSYISTRLQ